MQSAGALKMDTTARKTTDRSKHDSEQGFMLLGLIVAIAIILIVLGAAATKTAFSLRREREVESARRADQYVRAIRKFYIKNKRYPGSIKELESFNNARYLRQEYVDPLTGKDDYRLILVGQNKTTVKGFFGEPLAGIPTAGLGSAAGLQSSGVPGQTAGGSAANPTAGTAATSTGTTTTNGVAGSAGTPGQTSAGSTNGPFGQSSSSGTTSVGQFMGVGSSAIGNSLITVNEQTTYETWEFLYDPRTENLRQAAGLNAGASSTDAGALGTTPGTLGNTNGTNPINPTSSGNGANPPGTGTHPQP